MEQEAGWERTPMMRELLALQEEMARRGMDLATQVVKPMVAASTISGRDYSPYRDKPVEFCEDQLSVFLWSKQREVIEAVRDHPKVTVRSCHGVGKTFVAAATAIWFLFSRPQSLVITTAPTGRQVKELLWREIRRIHSTNKLPGRCLTTQLEVGEKWYAFGQATDEPVRFSGGHAADILLIADEASGIAEEIYEAAAGILTTEGARQMLIGNPLIASGYFFETHTSLVGSWHPIHISAFDSPNFTGERVPISVRAELITKRWQEERLEEWGYDDPRYQTRVLGEFPDKGEDFLFSQIWLNNSRDRFLNWQMGNFTYSLGEFNRLNRMRDIDATCAGLDVSRQGGNENVIYIRRGPFVLHYEAWHSDNLMQTAGKALSLCKQYAVRTLRVDANGVGAGVADRIREVAPGLVQDIQLGSTAKERDKFVLLRDEGYWNLRERFRLEAIGPVKDPKTRAQLGSLKATYDSRGRLKVSSKKEMREDGLSSPDRADALMMAFIPSLRSQGFPTAGGIRTQVTDYAPR